MRLRFWRPRQPDPVPADLVNVAAFLASLGGTHQQVAKSLRRMDVKGQRMDGANCPLAVALKKRFVFEGGYVNVNPRRVTLRVGGVVVSVLTPRPVSDFVYAVDDRGAYPDLIAA